MPTPQWQRRRSPDSPASSTQPDSYSNVRATPPIQPLLTSYSLPIFAQELYVFIIKFQGSNQVVQTWGRPTRGAYCLAEGPPSASQPLQNASAERRAVLCTPEGGSIA